MSLVVKYSLLSLPVASFGLGIWQLKRLEWKKNIIAMLEERLHAEPIDLMKIENISDLEKLEYRRIKANGRFDLDPRHQLYLKPRPLISNDEARRRGWSELSSNIGVNVITPFVLENTDLRILVNRGWLASKGRKDSIETGLSFGLQPKDNSKTIELVGIIRTSDKQPKFGMRNNETSNEWQIRDVEAMSRVLRTAPIYIDADESLSMNQGPIGGQTQLTVRNEHLNYAITWFSLSVLLLLMWYSKYGKSQRLSSSGGATAYRLIRKLTRSS